MNILCDRIDVCGSMILDRGAETVNVARARGWHMWQGQTLGGEYQEVILCPVCVEAGRRFLGPRTKPLEGQETLDLDP